MQASEKLSDGRWLQIAATLTRRKLGHCCWTTMWSGGRAAHSTGQPAALLDAACRIAVPDVALPPQIRDPLSTGRMFCSYSRAGKYRDLSDSALLLYASVHRSEEHVLDLMPCHKTFLGHSKGSDDLRTLGSGSWQALLHCLSASPQKCHVLKGDCEACVVLCTIPHTCLPARMCAAADLQLPLFSACREYCQVFSVHAVLQACSHGYMPAYKDDVMYHNAKRG